MYGAVMGLAGLGLTARAAAPVLPGVLKAPAYFTEPWVLLGALALALLLPPRRRPRPPGPCPT